MSLVQPLRDKDKIEAMKSELLKSGYRNFMIFIIGINTGLRVGDILQLKASDVRHKSHINIYEEKTKKYKKFLINRSLKGEIDKYIINMKDNDYLFPSRKGVNKPISVVQAYRVINEAAKRLGFDEVGTHTMRKSFGYWHYQQYKDVAILQDIFNHESPRTTLIYIGITQDQKDETIEDFFL